AEAPRNLGGARRWMPSERQERFAKITPPRRSGARPPARTRGPLTYERADPERRAPSASAGSGVSGRRPRQGPLSGDRGAAPAHPGIRGSRPEDPGQGRSPYVHGEEAFVWRRRGADVSRAFAEDRADRGRRAG